MASTSFVGIHKMEPSQNKIAIHCFPAVKIIVWELNTLI
jgi:hypothetical protein